MNTDSFIHADIFFLITSFSVIVVTIMIVWAGSYLIEAFRNFRDISRTLKKGVDTAAEDIEQVYHEIEESSIFRFIFGHRQHRGDTSSKKGGKDKT